MTLYMEKRDLKAWNYAQTLSDEQLLQGIINIIKNSDLDVDESYVAAAYFKRNDIEYRDDILNAGSKKDMLSYGIPEEDLVKIDD